MKIFLSSKSIDPAELTVRRENILTLLGVPYEKADSYLLNVIDELQEYCLTICSPKAAVTIAGQPVFSDVSKEVLVEGKTFELNKMIFPALSKSTSLAFFAGTCGEKAGRYSAQLIKDGHALEGLIVDIIGSQIAEGVAEWIHRKVESEMASQGLRITNRYSPGYCGWPVSDQQKLFGVLGENNCGIQLNESSLMLPEKSVSGVIGIGKNVVNKGYACSYCDTEQCIYRDKRQNPTSPVLV